MDIKTWKSSLVQEGAKLEAGAAGLTVEVFEQIYFTVNMFLWLPVACLLVRHAVSRHWNSFMDPYKYIPKLYKKILALYLLIHIYFVRRLS